MLQFTYGATSGKRIDTTVGTKQTRITTALFGDTGNGAGDVRRRIVPAEVIWTESKKAPSEEHVAQTYVSILDAAGVLDEAEAIWDALDAGENPCQAEPVEDLIARVTDARAE